MMITDLASMAFLGAISFGVLWFGRQKGFFRWDPNRTWDLSIRVKDVLFLFAIYFGIADVLVPLSLSQIKPLLQKPATQIELLSWLNLAIAILTLGGIFLYWRSLKDKSLWRNPSLLPNYREDFIYALYAWCISCPLVLFISQALESLVYVIFNVSSLPDQLAVYFVKMTFGNPLYFSLAIVTIVFLTPLIEETLFRAFLQSFIRKQLGPRYAIFITALCFSFFHFSQEQGLSNIPIVGSLFILALFLGFIYEKRGSLFASISLHALFNAVSIFNLYFLE